MPAARRTLPPPSKSRIDKKAMPEQVIDPKRNRFLWGLAVGWFTLVPLVYGCANAFKGVTEQKATGIGVIAGGIVEVCAIVGAFVLLVSPMIAIYLLVTSWSRGQAARNILALITMAWSGFTLFIILGAAWMILLFPYWHH